MTHTIDLEVRQVYFDAITSGAKTIEGRLAKPKMLELQSGDQVRFTNPDGTQELIKTVAAVHKYPTFAGAFKEQDYTNAIPAARNVDEALAVYEQFYPPAVQQEWGVVFIELR